MAIQFDPIARLIILDRTFVSAAEIYSRWVDWAATSDNLKYGMWIRQVGSDDLGGGLSIPPYFFLQSDIRVRPMEADHTLVVTGNLFVEGGGIPVVRTVGPCQVNVNYTVPVQAQGISTAGAGGASAIEVAAAVASLLSGDMQKLRELHELRGLDVNKPVHISDSGITTPTITQVFTKSGEEVVVTRE